MSNKAAVLKEAKGPLTIETRSIPSPQANEIVIRNHVIAINPVDSFMQRVGYFIKSYPFILGSDTCGIVEAVGPDVKHFKKGDRIAGFAPSIATGKMEHGAFQQYPIVFENAAVKLPDNVSFEEGATLPMAVATSGGAIFTCLEISRSPSKQNGGFLVWGGSSAVGTAAVQIAASLGFKVFAVCSTHHHSYVKSLGATEVFDYNDSAVVKNIISSVKAAGVEIKYAYDCISKSGSLPRTTAVLEEFGGGKLAITLPWPEDIKKPESVTVSMIGAFRVVTDQKDFGKWLFNDWLEKSLVEKRYVPSPEIEKIGGGLDSIQKAIDHHGKGVSGKKIVVTVL